MSYDPRPIMVDLRTQTNGSNMDFDPFSMAASAVASGIGAVLNYQGTKAANRANKKMAREQMAFQAEQNQKQMDYQERMSNTAYQRAMADMYKAGLNPILAYNQGGASSPAGSTGSGAMAMMQNELAGSSSSAVDALRTNAELKQLKANTELLDQNWWKAKAETKLLNEQRRLTKANSAKAQKEAEWVDAENYRKWVDSISDVFPYKGIFKK